MTPKEIARRATVVAVCLAVTLLALVYRFVGDETLWGAWLSMAPPILWAVALVPTVVRLRVPPRMPSLGPLDAFLRDAWRVAGRGWGATMPEFLPLTRIDHVWMSEDIEILSVRAHKLPGSDHRAVVVDFEL